MLRDIWRIADALLAWLCVPQLPAVRATDADMARLLREPHADAALRLLIAEADNEPSGWPHSARTWLRALRRLRLETPIVRWRPQLWVTGEDLKRMGHAPSAKFRLAIAAAETVQLQGGSPEAARLAAAVALAATDTTTQS